MAKKVLITGCAGFIGFHTTSRLLADGYKVTGIDNLNDYYTPVLKQKRLKVLKDLPEFQFCELDLSQKEQLADLVEGFQPDCCINLAAQAGVRWSIEHPWDYVDSNLVGFLAVLEACRTSNIKHLIYASSSSVYGANTKQPFSVADNVDHPVSLYAATKKANELMAHSYSHLYGIPTTGLRFFTVYEPWGRPDMAYWKFTAAIDRGDEIELYGNGELSRDFTYVDDVVEAIVRLVNHPPLPNKKWQADEPDPATSSAPWRVLNVGNDAPLKVKKLVEVIEKELGRKAIVKNAPMQPGDVVATSADIDALKNIVDFAPETSIEDGMAKFISWFREYKSEQN